MNKNTLLVLLTLICCTASYSQDILSSTIEWNCVTTFDAQNGIFTNEDTRVVSSSTHITWYDTNNNVKYNLKITDVDGSWPNVSHNGSIEYNVIVDDEANADDKVAVVQFRKASGKTIIVIHFVLQDGKSVYELTVNNVNTL